MLSAGQHTLTTQADTEDSSKICILVKLTDSSVKVIEEYLKNKNNSKKPSIQFVQKDKGEIILPIDQKPDSDSSGGYQLKKFLFGLSSVKETNKDTSASSECISYNGSKLKTIATIEQKLNVQANDEVFLATKEKVNSVVEEEKKNSTIEIKPSGAIVNRNSNYGSGNINMKQPKQGVAAQMVAKSNISNPDAAKQRPPVLDRPLRERLIHLLAIKSYNRAEILLKLNKDAPLSDRDKDNIDSILQSVAVLNSSKNSYDLTTEVMLNEVKDDWQFYSQSEKSYAKKRIALKQQQQQQQQQQMSLNQSLNSSTLSAPNTSSTPSNAAHKQLNQSLNFPNRPSTSSSSSTASAFVSIKQQQNTSASMNKSMASNLTNSFEELNSSIDTTKKISPLKTENFKPAIKTSPSSSSYQMAASKHAHQHMKSQSSKIAAAADSLKVSPDYDNDETNTSTNWSQQNQNQPKKQPNEKENESEGAKKKLKPDLANKDRLNDIETNELNECARRYKKIQSKQQKDQYTIEFDKFYNEYVELHHYFETLSKKYNKFKQELDMIKKDDTSQDTYNEKKLKIVQDYLSRQADAEYMKKRDRYSQIYVKLKYIEDLCKEYDNSE